MNHGPSPVAMVHIPKVEACLSGWYDPIDGECSLERSAHQY